MKTWATWAYLLCLCPIMVAWPNKTENLAQKELLQKNIISNFSGKKGFYFDHGEEKNTSVFEYGNIYRTRGKGINLNAFYSSISILIFVNHVPN